MVWQAFFTAFVTVFVAELGDKTQIATFGLAGAQASKLAVFAGASLALCANAAIAVVLGELVSRHVPPHVLQRVAGVVFVVLGALYLIGSFRTGA